MCSTSDSTSDRHDADDDGCWLVRDGRVLASLEIPTSRKEKAIGLLGRTGLEGAILFRPARSIHTVGMKFPLDVALLDANNTVIKMLHVRRHRISAPIWRARSVIEAEAGAFNSWGLKLGDVLEIRE